MRTRRRGLVVGACLLAALSPHALEAQAGAQRGGADRAQLEQRVRAQMGRVMRERLGLGEEEAARLSEVTQRYEDERRELFALEQATRRRVEALLLEGGTDQDEARELISRMAELRQREATLFQDEQEALLDVLTPVQVLRLQQLRQDLGQRIRALGGGGDAQGPGPARGGRVGGGLPPGRGGPRGGAPGL
jgi:Spy/CpxP family protein refolding chaperone